FMVGSADRRALRAAVARAIDHGALRGLCVQLSSQSAPGNLSAPLRPCLSAISQDLKRIAGELVTLQDLRHRADYHRLVPITKLGARKAVRGARDAIDAWHRLGGGREAHTFLLGALAWRSFSGR